jgi:hypothetical protein
VRGLGKGLTLFLKSGIAALRKAASLPYFSSSSLRSLASSYKEEKEGFGRLSSIGIEIV